MAAQSTEVQAFALWSDSNMIEAEEVEMQYQLRDYDITPGAMSEFVAEWKTKVVPLRAKAGFEVVSAWSSPETNRFVWIVAHEGDFEEADRIYYASPDRAQLSPDPARFVAEARTELVSPAL